MKRFELLIALPLLCIPIAAQRQTESLEWNARQAEHLLNRAGFGAGVHTIERAVEIGQAALVAELLRGVDDDDAPFFTRVRRSGALMDRDTGMEMTGDAKRKRAGDVRRNDRAQLEDFQVWWIERLLESDDVLRERMTLFWHGHFTSSMDDVKNSHEMIVQNQLLRSHALGDFRELVHSIARDPAMLEYLDNDANRRGKPNENFARELMELFTLGEGHYTEEDVKEAARAFTGWADQDGRFRFARGRHDYGEKTVLGTTGLLDGDDVIDILIGQDECARFLATKLLTYFEGVAPRAGRIDEYADLLRASDFVIAPVLEAMFMDPDFYRDEVVGARIAGPIDYLVGCARRLGGKPPAGLISLASNVLGQHLLYPPNVKGWEGGRAWITTGTLMQRGNLAGVLLGEVSLSDFQDDVEPEADGMLMDAMANVEEPARQDSASNSKSRKQALGKLRALKRFGRLGRRINLTLILSDADAVGDVQAVRALCDGLLAIHVDDDTCASLAGILREEREAAELAEGAFEDQPWDGEPVLRRFAHLLLSLPEAQLH